MADNVPEVAAEYGPPNPFEASPDQPGSYGPPSDVFTGGGGSSSGTASSGGSIDLSGLVKAAGDAVGTVVKTVSNLATPPTPQIPTPPSPPNLPATIPFLPTSPAQPGPGATPAAPPVRTDGGIAPSGAAPAVTKLSTGAKVAIGLGLGSILIGGGLLIASAGQDRKR